MDCVTHLNVRVNHLVRSMVLNRIVLDPHLKLQQALEFHSGINPILFWVHILFRGWPWSKQCTNSTINFSLIRKAKITEQWCSMIPAYYLLVSFDFFSR